MPGFQREVRVEPRTQEEIAAQRFDQSQVGRLIAAIREFAQGCKADVERGAETPGLASLMVEKYGYGLMKAADVLAVEDSHLLTAEVDRLVAEIDPQHCKHQQYR